MILGIMSSRGWGKRNVAHAISAFERSDEPKATGDEVLAWIEQHTDVVLTPWQEKLVHTMYDRQSVR